MSQELNVTANSLPSKATTAAYVHDMAEIEAREFTLRKAKIELLNGTERIQKEAEEIFQEENEKFREVKGKAKWYRTAKRPSLKLDGGFIGYSIIAMFMSYIPVVLLLAIIMVTLEVNGVIGITTKDKLFTQIALIGGAVLSVSIPLIVVIIKTTIDHIGDLRCHSSNKLYYESAYPAAERRYNQAQEDYNNAQKSISFIKQQAENAGKQADEIAKIKNKLYAVGIIPPDYREMDCVIMFDQIFRNDLADTMREAVKIYEERVFRGEVIRGIDKIYSQLGRLAATMSSIETRLYGIHKDVVSMSDDLYSFSRRAENLSKTQEELLRETKYNRYANESLAESAKKLEKYTSNF